MFVLSHRLNVGSMRLTVVADQHRIFLQLSHIHHRQQTRQTWENTWKLNRFSKLSENILDFVLVLYYCSYSLETLCVSILHHIWSIRIFKMKIALLFNVLCPSQTFCEAVLFNFHLLLVSIPLVNPLLYKKPITMYYLTIYAK